MKVDFWRGVRSGAAVWALVLIALLPSRLAVAMRARGGTGIERATRAVAGALLDWSHIAWLVAVVVMGLLLVSFVVPALRARVLRIGAVLAALPACATLYLVTVTEQEVKAERGAFSTLQEMLDAAGESSFVEGAPGFIRYRRIWLPLVICGIAFVALLFVSLRTKAVEHARPWFAGLISALIIGIALAPLIVGAQARMSDRLSPAGLGDPLASVVESAVDLAAGRSSPKPAELLSELKPTPEEIALGAKRLGWPAPVSDAVHPYARPLDRTREPRAPVDGLLTALEKLSVRLFESGDERVAVFQVSLESFRGDDLNALNPRAPAQLAPFTNALYERPHPGVLASRRTFQGGVRTAQGLASMTCGLGTLPWNLSLIRELGDVKVRCAPDVFASAGFEGSFFYGSDATYDQMSAFLMRHGISHVVAEEQFSADTPRGSWGGVTDFALFDEAARRVADQLKTRPQFVVLMSLSNHSPFTPPADLPDSVPARAAASILSTEGRATGDELKRLTTWSYTDAAVERLFAQLDTLKVSDRSIIVLIADHSTGDDYVWGPDSVDHETDAAKAGIPFLVIIPAAFLERIGGATELLDAVQHQLDLNVLSQNDLPALMLALLSAHPLIKSLPGDQRWHTLGGQRTSPWFDVGEPNAAILGINGVDELFVLDAQGTRIGAYEDVTFLRSRDARKTVTPRLIPVASTLVELSRH